ncbi:MAG: ABC transporter permease [Bacteroidota bacterium]
MEKPIEEQYQPPKRAQRFLLYFLKKGLAEEVQGDLDEMFYYRLERSSPFKARINYWLQVFNYLRPFAIRNFQPLHPINFAMYQHYVKISLRQFAKNKVYLLVNTLGLGIALACCIVAYLLVAYNVEFDSIHDPQKVSAVFKVHASGKNQGDEEWREIGAPVALGPAVSSDIAGVNRFTRFISTGGYISHGTKGFRERISFADTTFFDMFDFPLLQGNTLQFKDKASILVSKTLANKLFGEENPIGETVRVRFEAEEVLELIVGGVLNRIPVNNTFDIVAIVPFENYLDIMGFQQDNWSDWRNPATFFELASPENAPQVSTQLASYLPLRNEAKTDGVTTQFILEPFLSSFDTKDIDQNYVSIRMEPLGLLLFGPLALMILLIACFNLTNISIATTSKRIKEIGLRKAIGAARKEIFSQFLFETFLTMSLALLFGYMLSHILASEFTTMVDWGYSMEDLSGLNLFISLIIILFLASCLAGIYPALRNSRLHPIELFKGATKIKGTNWLSRTLVGAQFALSIIFLISGIIFSQNMQFQETMDFGYPKEELLEIYLPGNTQYQGIEAMVEAHPKVKSVGATRSHIGRNTYTTFVEIASNSHQVQAMGVGKNYLETMGLSLVEGRGFNWSGNYDIDKGAIVNQAFLEATGLEDPYQIQVILHEEPRQIVGIISNHIDNLQRSIDPEPFIYFPMKADKYTSLAVRVAPNDLTEVRSDLEKSWKNEFPDLPFDSQYQEDIVLENERNVHATFQKIFFFLTILGVILSISGIFALSSLNISRRIKEIGVRKILGASVKQIVGLINREFVVILSISAVLGIFGSIFFTDSLLGSIYESHIPIGILPVAIGALVILVIGLLTTTSTILKAALADPVHSLRSE